MTTAKQKTEPVRVRLRVGAQQIPATVHEHCRDCILVALLCSRLLVRLLPFVAPAAAAAAAAAVVPTKKKVLMMMMMMLRLLINVRKDAADLNLLLSAVHLSMATTTTTTTRGSGGRWQPPEVGRRGSEMSSWPGGTCRLHVEICNADIDSPVVPGARPGLIT